jgi:hypothetical protein
MNFNFSQLDNKSKITLGALALIVISTFFPWIKVMSQSVSAWQTFTISGNFFGIFGMLAAAVSGYFFIKEKYDYAFYASLVGVVNILNWYFLWFGGFETFSVGAAKSAWRNALSTGYYLSVIGSLGSSYLLAERIGLIEKLIKKVPAKSIVPKAATVNPPVPNASAEAEAAPSTVTKAPSGAKKVQKKTPSKPLITKRVIVIGAILAILGVGGFFGYRYFYAPSYQAFDYIKSTIMDYREFSKLSNNMDKGAFKAEKAKYYSSLASKNEKFELKDMYVYGVVKISSGDGKSYSEETYGKKKPLYRIFLAPYKKMEDGKVVATGHTSYKNNVSDFANAFGIDGYGQDLTNLDMGVTASDLQPVDMDDADIKRLTVGINVYSEEAMADLLHAGPVFVGAKMYSAAIGKQYNFDSEENKFIPSFFTTSVSALVSYPEYDENNDPIYSDQIFFDLNKFTSIQTVESKSRKLLEEYYTLDLKQYQSKLQNCLKENLLELSSDESYFSSIYALGKYIYVADYLPLGSTDYYGYTYGQCFGDLRSALNQIKPIQDSTDVFVGTFLNGKYYTGEFKGNSNHEALHNLYRVVIDSIGFFDKNFIYNRLIENERCVYLNGKISQIKTFSDSPLIFNLDSNNAIISAEGIMNTHTNDGQELVYVISKKAGEAMGSFTYPSGRIAPIDFTSGMFKVDSPANTPALTPQ